MTLHDQVLAHAMLLAGELTPQQNEALAILCTGSISALRSRLRQGLTPEDCKADFIAAASLYALSGLSGIGGDTRMEQISAGDFTVRTEKTDAASNCLRAQAQLLIAPYLADSFSFLGV